MESFFGISKRELIYRETYATRIEASTFEYIETSYNNHRRKHSANNYQAMLVFEEQTAVCA